MCLPQSLLYHPSSCAHNAGWRQDGLRRWTGEIGKELGGQDIRPDIPRYRLVVWSEMEAPREKGRQNWAAWHSRGRQIFCGQATPQIAEPILSASVSSAGRPGPPRGLPNYLHHTNLWLKKGMERLVHGISLRGQRQHQHLKCQFDEWVSPVQPICMGFPGFTNGGVGVDAVYSLPWGKSGGKGNSFMVNTSFSSSLRLVRNTPKSAVSFH